MKLALNTFTYANAKGLDVAREALRAGFEGLGLFSGHADELREAGWSDGRALGEYVEFLAPDTSRSRLRGRMEQVRKCGARWLTLVPAASWRSLEGWEIQVRAVLAGLAESSRELNVALAIEPLHPSCAAASCVTDPVVALRLLEDLPFSDFGWVLDAAHVSCSAEALALPGALERLKSVHLADVRSLDRPEERCLLGDGVLPLKSLLADLARAGYGGWYEVELQGSEAERRPLVDHLRASHERARRLLAEVA